MNQTLKAGILLATLAIPVFIWLFLKNFGQNQFNLPVYYEEEVPSIRGCNDTVTPHQVQFFTDNAELNSRADEGLSDKVKVAYMLPEICDNECQLVLEQLANLQTTFSDRNDFQIVVFAPNQHFDDVQISEIKKRYLANPQTWKIVLTPADDFNNLFKCEFFLSEADFSQTLVLTDASAMIRGYYQGFDPDEIDRLKGELKILFYMQETADHVKSSK